MLKIPKILLKLQFRSSDIIQCNMLFFFQMLDLTLLRIKNKNYKIGSTNADITGDIISFNSDFIDVKYELLLNKEHGKKLKKQFRENAGIKLLLEDNTYMNLFITCIRGDLIEVITSEAVYLSILDDFEGKTSGYYSYPENFTGRALKTGMNASIYYRVRLLHDLIIREFKSDISVPLDKYQKIVGYDIKKEGKSKCIKQLYDLFESLNLLKDITGFEIKDLMIDKFIKFKKIKN